MEGVRGRKLNRMNPNKNNLYYNKVLQSKGNELRKNMTKAEACLWKFVLKAKKLKGYSFRRPRPVLKYITDFMCKELMLIIEVGGYAHLLYDTIKKDIIKTKHLEEHGFKVVRLSDNEVLKNISDVKMKLENVIEDIESSTP